MNQSQRAAAERLADALNEGYAYAMDEAAALLRELLAEQWLTSAKLDACMASRDALRDWAQECRDQVLYLLAQRDDELGRLADGFGQASVALLRELLAEPQGEPVGLDAVRQAIEERDDMERKYHDLAEHMVYHGNSVSWWHSKARAYRDAVDKVWSELKAAGIVCDGIKTSADGVRELANPPQQRKPLTDDEALALIRATPQEDVTQEGWIRRQRLSWVRAIERAHGITGEPT